LRFPAWCGRMPAADTELPGVRVDIREERHEDRPRATQGTSP